MGQNKQIRRELILVLKTLGMLILTHIHGKFYHPSEVYYTWVGVFYKVFSSKVHLIHYPQLYAVYQMFF